MSFYTLRFQSRALKIVGMALSVFVLPNEMQAQNYSALKTETVFRVNFLNPGIEMELPTGTYSTFSAGLGIGYGGAYPDINFGGSGFVYIIAPFLDLQQKLFYNREKRHGKGYEINHNSGNFFSIRFITRGNSIAENVNRTSNFDFAIGPTWGIQRSYKGNFHVLFDVGPQFYLDTNGNGNVWPVMLQLNLGFDL